MGVMSEDIATGQAFVVAGPTAVGKGTVLREVMARAPQCWMSISATTRSPRPGEIDGKHYYFVKVTQADGNTLWSAPIWVSVLPQAAGERAPGAGW